jgi:acetyl esterase/lipase
MIRWLILATIALIAAPGLRADDAPRFDRTQDVIYGRKVGVALTLDVFTPKENANGAAIVVVISGGWKSDHDIIDVMAKAGFGTEFFKRGYAVFAVVHGCQPKFTIPEAVSDMHRAVRFIRHNAKNYRIDPDRIGITGASAGCHLSLMMGVGGKDGNASAKDPVEQASSKVQAVAGFFPPTDFFNWGGEGKSAEGLIKAGPFAPAFDFRDRNGANNWVSVPDEKRKDILKEISPIYHVTDKTPPTLLFHGDLDLLVPIHQSKIMIEKLKENKVPCELVIHKGGRHGWAGIDKDLVTIADWFDKYLPKKN